MIGQRELHPNDQRIGVLQLVTGTPAKAGSLLGHQGPVVVALKRTHMEREGCATCPADKSRKTAADPDNKTRLLLANVHPAFFVPGKSNCSSKQESQANSEGSRLQPRWPVV